MAQVQISDMILDSFRNCRDFLATFFGVEPTDVDSLSPFVKIQAALRGMPPEALDEVAKPILSGMFEEYGLDPKHPKDRKVAAEIVDVFALGIQDAIHMIAQAMQQQAAAQQALASGRGNLLRT